MWRAGKAWLPVLLAGFGADKTTSQSWQHVYDIDSLPEAIGSVAFDPADTSYRIFSYAYASGLQRMRFAAIDASGDTIFTKRFTIGSPYLLGGGSGSFREAVDGTTSYCGALTYSGGAEPDGVVWKFTNAGDSLWMQVIGDSALEGFNSLAPMPGGGTLLVGVKRASQPNVWAVAIDASGNVLWEEEYGGPMTENGISVMPTPDGGYIIGGFKTITGANDDMYALKIDGSGNEQWAHNYGSPWMDNVCFITPAPVSGYLLAGAQSLSSANIARPCLYRLNSVGDTLWSRIYDDMDDRTFFTIPTCLEDNGFAIAGTANGTSNIIGMLSRTNSIGDRLWRRTYKTNDVYDHYIYDLRRTLDGGFIMAGTAFDSMLVSQDAWLIKVDSFGCLVPGCQGVGVQEYVTGLGAALVVSPNPARDRFSFELRIPETISVAGPVRASLLYATGRLVMQKTVTAIGNTVSDSFTLPPDRPSGMLYLHLYDDRQWLAGTKIVIQ